MSCAYQLDAWKPARGGPVLFQKPTNGHAYSPIKIPCGQCILCRLEHARQWAVRITHEATLHDKNGFVTLTYNDDNLPQYNSLHYPDLQRFWKRLRKKFGKLRYYAVGEYGDKTQRPHYHACVFGQEFTDDRVILRKTPTLLWTSPHLEEAWGLGHVSVGALNFQTAQYTSSYVTKKLNNKKQYVRVDTDTGELIKLEQPRAFMSLKPAIGLEWLKTNRHYTYDHDRVVINGRPQKPPKYYDLWLEKQSPIQHDYIKENRRHRATKMTDEQTHARAINAHARAKQKQGTI